MVNEEHLRILKQGFAAWHPSPLPAQPAISAMTGFRVEAELMLYCSNTLRSQKSDFG